MMNIGTTAPMFSLLNTVSNKEISLNELKAEIATVIVFICNHCPFVHHINAKLVDVANYYQPKGIQFIAISSNNVATHPQDGPTFMAEVAKKEKYPFPYLYDETQAVAKAYKAECTPDFFVFDGDLKCAYRGRFDETRPNLGAPTGKELCDALDALLASRLVNPMQHPSIGCNIKWK